MVKFIIGKKSVIDKLKRDNKYFSSFLYKVANDHFLLEIFFLKIFSIMNRYKKKRNT